MRHPSYQACGNHMVYNADCSACLINTSRDIMDAYSEGQALLVDAIKSLLEERTELRAELRGLKDKTLLDAAIAERNHWIAQAEKADAQLARTRAALSELLELAEERGLEDNDGPLLEARIVLENTAKTYHQS